MTMAPVLALWPSAVGANCKNLDRKYFLLFRQAEIKLYVLKLKKIDHIGIAVKDLEVSNTLFEKLLGTASYKTEEVPSERVRTSFFKTGDSKIELLEGLSEDSPIVKFLEKRGEGVHHIAFAVDDIAVEVERLKSEGFTVLNEVPKRGADNKLVVFLHPKSSGGVLIELCQEVP